jgi:cytochrome c-type biogenesis protein CcmH
MSQHLMFILATLATTALVVLALVSGLLRPSRQAPALQRDANIGVYRQQLVELQAEHAAGRLDAGAFAQARDELSQRLLQDTEGETPAVPSPAPRAWMTAMLLGVLLPAAAVLSYLALGEPDALDPQQVQSATDQHPELQSMADGLARTLDSEGGSAQRWATLARTYRTLEQYEKALPAYDRALAQQANDDLLLERAEVLAFTRAGDFQGEPLQAIRKVLRQNPHHHHALLLAGSAAYAQGDYRQALDHWLKAQAQQQGQDGDADELAQAIAKAREKIGQPDTPSAAPAAPASPAVAGRTLSGRVELGELARQQVGPQDTVFIYAVATQGSRAPLAIVRSTVAQLPTSFVLDDTTAMNPEHKLSAQSSVWIKARISRSGEALPRPGDWVGTFGPAEPGRNDIRLVINEALR